MAIDLRMVQDIHMGASLKQHLALFFFKVEQMDVISQPIAVAADFGIQISSRPKSINMTTYGYFYRQPL